MSESRETISEALLARFVPMSALSEHYLRELSQHARFVDLPADAPIADVLASVESIVYLVEGAVRFSGTGQPDSFTRASDPAARFALQGAEIAGRDVHTVEPTRLLRVERAKVSTLMIWAEASGQPPLSRDEQRLRQDLTTLLMHSRLFERVPPGNIERIAELIEPLRLNAGDVVVRQGEPGDHYYVVEQGTCEVLRESADGGEPLRIAHLEAGDSFGEEALLTDSVRNASVRMESDGVVMRLNREYFVELISSPLVTAVAHERAEDLVATGARWVDVRLREEFERDGLDGALNIPLGELRARAGELSVDGSYVTYCNSGRRAQAGAFLMSQRGMHTSYLRGGIAVQRPARRGPVAAADSLPSLRTALLEADAELDRALREKAEADAAQEVERRMLQPSRAETAAQQRLRELTANSERASGLLRASMNRKRELEARVREVEADEASRRRAAEAQLEQMRGKAARRLEQEKQRLTERYQSASEQLQAIEQARRQAEERFERERARMERELEEARARMAAEAARIRETMEGARQQAESKAHEIRSEYVQQEQLLRARTEDSLRAERSRLEQEFASSIAAQEQARQELDAAESERRAAERETEQLRRLAEQQLAERRTQEIAARDAEVERLREAGEAAREQLQRAQSRRDAAERHREDYSRTLGEKLDAATPEREAELRRELAQFDQALASADDALEQAEQDHASATTAQTIAEETAAVAQERVDELRVEVYEELEEWISDEEARTREQLETSSHYASQIDRIQAEKQARRAAENTTTDDMFSDVQQMLAGGADAGLAAQMRSRLAAEEKARLIQRARKETKEQLDRARAAADRSKPE